jgi:hypothetical protein
MLPSLKIREGQKRVLSAKECLVEVAKQQRKMALAFTSSSTDNAGTALLLRCLLSGWVCVPIRRFSLAGFHLVPAPLL